MISRDTPANVIQSAAAPHASATASWRSVRGLGLSCVSVYLMASGVVLGASGHVRLAALHTLVIVVARIALDERRAVTRTMGDLLPLIVAPLLYGEIPALIAAVGSHYHDALIAGWESRLFAGQPARVLAGLLPSQPLSELLHAGYLSYYLVIFLPPLWLWVVGRRGALHSTVLALTITYTLCWVLYVAFPVEGPRYLWTAPAGVPDGFFRRLAVRILAAGSSRGAAFPSSHMAISVVQAVMAWRWQPRMTAVVLTAVSVLVGVGAVYGGFHYATDMLAGTIVGLVISGLVWRFAP